MYGEEALCVRPGAGEGLAGRPTLAVDARAARAACAESWRLDATHGLVCPPVRAPRHPEASRAMGRLGCPLGCSTSHLGAAEAHPVLGVSSNSGWCCLNCKGAPTPTLTWGRLIQGGAAGLGATSPAFVRAPLRPTLCAGAIPALHPTRPGPAICHPPLPWANSRTPARALAGGRGLLPPPEQHASTALQPAPNALCCQHALGLGSGGRGHLHAPSHCNVTA
jgi:hypothetical protein